MVKKQLCKHNITFVTKKVKIIWENNKGKVTLL